MPVPTPQCRAPCPASGTRHTSLQVILQMNCKAGGAPWTVDMKLAKPTMIVGLDVHHGGDLEHKAGSVAGFVATMNRECTQYYSRTFQVPLPTSVSGLRG